MHLCVTILLWILGILAAVLLLLLICPVWVWLRLDYDKLSVQLQLLGLKFKLYPGKENKRPAKEKAPKQKKEKADKPKKKSGEPAQKAKLSFEKLVAIVRTAGAVAKRAMGALKFRDICVYYPLYCEDPADTAIRYGQAAAFVSTGMAALETVLDLQFKQVQLVPDFGGDNKYRLSFSCKIGTCPLIMVGIAIYAFCRLRKERII